MSGPPPPVVIQAPAQQPASSAVAPSASGESAPNAVFLELLGNGLLYSVNYERLLTQWNVGLRAGVGFVAYKVSSANGAGALVLASFPLVASWYYGSGNHRLQLGLGATVLYVKASTDAAGLSYQGSVPSFGVAATAVIGYRYWPRHGGFTFGAGFTPLLRESKGILPWGGAEAGFAF